MFRLHGLCYYGDCFLLTFCFQFFFTNLFCCFIQCCSLHWNPVIVLYNLTLQIIHQEMSIMRMGNLHVWQKEDSHWTSIIISRPSAHSYEGNWHVLGNTMVFNQSMSTKTEHSNTDRKPVLKNTQHTPCYSVYWPIQTKQQETARLNSQQAN